MQTLFEFNGLEVCEDGGRYYVIYDAGAHQVVLRKDEITKQEAELAMSGRNGLLTMIWALQKRLSEHGLDPYVSNFVRE